METIIDCRFHYESAAEAQKALPVIQNFFLEGIRAYKFWKQHKELKREIFWRRFAERYPSVSEYLKSAGLFGNEQRLELAGRLGFGDKNDVAKEMVANGKTICFKAQAWDLAEWDSLFSFVVKKYAAQRYSNKKLEEYTKSLASLERWSVIKEKEKNEPAFATNV